MVPSTTFNIRVVYAMGKLKRKQHSFKLLRSSRAMALPITFLMLFASLIILISATYYFSMTRITAKTLELKAAGVEQEMLSLEKVTKSVAWSPGAYETYEFGDFGGQFKAAPAEKRLTLNLTDNSSFYEVFFDNSIGKIVYELPSSETEDNLFLKGDNRVIVNQSSSTMTQLVISKGTEFREITLSYRPLAGSTVNGESGGKPVNSLRIYIVSLNSSQSITRLGSFRLKISCLNVTSSWKSYDFSYTLKSLLVKANLDGVSGEVSLPISSSAQGAVVNLETIVCSVKIEDVGW